MGAARRRQLVRGSPEWQWAPALQPRESEAQIHKQFNSSFEQTRRWSHAFTPGGHAPGAGRAATNWCIRATAYAALERGYDLTLVQDAHTTGTMDLDNGVKIELRP
jgi:nicotinamidase-related amidase